MRREAKLALGKTIGAACAAGARFLRGGASPAMDARFLLLDALQFGDFAELLAKSEKPLPQAAAQKYARHLRERRRGVPVAYILGWREFYGRRFRATPAAMIPRPETEILVDAALPYLRATAGARALDMGAGCGAVGLTLAMERPTASVWLSDVAAKSLALARQNAAKHSIANAKFCEGDGYAAVAGARAFDLIVSNPPYIAKDDEHLQRGDLRFEPKLALVGGADGLAALAWVVGGAFAHLRAGGVLMVEHGLGQARAVRRLFARAGFCGMASLPDLSGIARVMLGARP